MSSFERLERRRLLAGDGVWTITGSDSGESITIDLRASDQRLRAIVNGEVVSTRLLRGLGLIEVISNGGNDVIKLDLHDRNAGLGIWVNAGPGRDRVFGGAGDENLGGGSGRDVIDGGRGNDIVRGGTDRDDVSGGDGNDYVQGNAGNDTLAGGWGDDRITGGTGLDQLRGGAGGDRIAGGKDADVLKGGAGGDVLEAGGGVGNTIFRLGGDQTVTGASDRLLEDDNADDSDSLQRVETDHDLKDWLIDQAIKQWKSNFGQETNTYWGYDRGMLFFADSSVSIMSSWNSSTPPPTSGGVLTGSADSSDTNIQEQGVDEADLVETDGQYLYMLHNNELIIVDADPAADISILSRTKIEGLASGIYLDGDRLTVLSETGGFYRYWGTGGARIQIIDFATSDVIAPPAADPPKVHVTVFDVTDRANPDEVSQTDLDGSLSSSRVIDGRLYIVLQNYLNTPVPRTEKVGDKELYESESAYRARLEAGGIDEMIPGFTSDSGDGSLLVAPDVFVRDGDRLDTTTVALINLRAPSPTPISSTSVIGAQGQVYASSENLYLAGYGWGTTPQTELLKFALGHDQVSLAASGEVAGSVLNQFSMDEEGEFFRIATTQTMLDGRTTHNGVAVLDQVGDDLTIVGKIEDLGLEERIFSARFVGDRAYLVTFRQIDPLFVLDLSDPTAPELKGELKIPGFSSYLHPISEDLLIGVGQNATDAGATTNLQLSLFNVSDPSNPTRVATYEFPENSTSPAALDHHAFSYFPEQGVLALPVLYSRTEVLAVESDGFHRLGAIEHDGNVSRSVRIGDNLFSIGSDAVRVHSLSDLNDEIAVLELPQLSP